MAHGLGAERSFRLSAYAERCANKGLGSFIFDLVNQISGALHGLCDLLCMLVMKRHDTVPITGKTNHFALMNTPDAQAGMRALIPADSAWQNADPALIPLGIPFYRPLSCARRISASVMIIAAENDTLIAYTAVKKTAGRIANASPCGGPLRGLCGRDVRKGGRAGRRLPLRQSEPLKNETRFPVAQGPEISALLRFPALAPGLDILVADAGPGLFAPGQTGFLEALVGVFLAAGRAGQEDIVLPELDGLPAAAAWLRSNVRGFEMAGIHAGTASFHRTSYYCPRPMPK